MAYREKYKALILKYVPCILKYVPYIFCFYKCTKYNDLQNGENKVWNRGVGAQKYGCLRIGEQPYEVCLFLIWIRTVSMDIRLRR